MQVSNAQESFIQELSAALATERTLVDALEDFSGQATDPNLQSHLSNHLEESRQHVTRLEEVFGILDQGPQQGDCYTATQLLEEAQENVAQATTAEAKDLVIAHWGLKADSFEIAGYTMLLTAAQQAGMDEEVVQRLSLNLMEDQNSYQQGASSAPTLVQAAQA